LTGSATADVVVVGLGAAGSAVLWQLARHGGGIRVVGIDRHHPPHALGSSHGESRITRLAVGEGLAYAPLVARSHELWRELESLTGEELMLETGGLLLGPPGGATRHHGREDFVARTIAVARRRAIPHEVLGAAEMAARFPQLGLRGDEVGFLEPTAGLLHPERCVAAQLRLARERGARVRTGETVLAIEERAGGVELVTDRGRIEAGQVVVAAGPWAGSLVGGVGRLAEVHRQTLHWFEPTEAAAYAPQRFPVFIWLHGETEEDYFYGFPMLPGSAGVKVASERYGVATDPETVDREVSTTESAEMYRRHVAGRLRGVTPRSSRAAACVYTVVPGSRFLVDRAPGRERVTVVSACSGHGFKHSAALGEAVAERLLAGASRIDLAPFSLEGGAADGAE
jgi:sarcosine oxidase